MIVLGISGFENSVPFKKSHWPGLDGARIPDFARPRLGRGSGDRRRDRRRRRRRSGSADEKHTGDFPRGAIQYCLSAAGIKPDDVDEIAHSFDYSPYRPMFLMDPVSAEQYRLVFSREALLEQLNRALPSFPADRVHQVNHHLAHAASAYFTSGWDECLVVVIDGMGEAQSATVYHAHDNQLEKLEEISANDSIGILYSVITLHLGFDFNSDEYKIMGLAPYGDPSRFRIVLPAGRHTAGRRQDPDSAAAYEPGSRRSRELWSDPPLSPGSPRSVPRAGARRSRTSIATWRRRFRNVWTRSSCISANMPDESAV